MEHDDRNNPPHVRIIFGVVFLIGAIAAGYAGLTSEPDFLFMALACLAGGGIMLTNGILDVLRQRKSLTPPMTGEQKILRAVYEGEGITPAEAAMEASIPVKEAHRMLSELASGGHLKVESEDGMLVYSLPRKRNREIQ